MPHKLFHHCEGCGSRRRKIRCPECGGKMVYDWGSEGHICTSMMLEPITLEDNHPITGGYDGYK